MPLDLQRETVVLQLSIDVVDQLDLTIGVLCDRVRQKAPEGLLLGASQHSENLQQLLPVQSSLRIECPRVAPEHVRFICGRHVGEWPYTLDEVVVHLGGQARFQIDQRYGGVVRGSDGGVVSEAAADFIRRSKMEYALIGTSVIDFDFREVKVVQAII